MIKLKNRNRNREQAEEYINNFSPSVREECYNLISTLDYEMYPSVFKKHMKLLFKMPNFTKHSLKYWLVRGWSEEESKELRVKLKRDPSKSPMNKMFWVNKGFTEEESEFKIKSQRKCNVEYWTHRGFSIDVAEVKRSEFQKETIDVYIDKYNSDEDFKKRVDAGRTNNVNYWINRGYSEEESIRRVSDRQRTFSLDICISKHGEERGMEIWNERQMKWRESLDKSGYDGVSGKSVTMEHRVENYTIEGIIKSLSLSNPDIFIELFHTCDTIEDFIEGYSNYVGEIDEISLYRIMSPLKRLKVLLIYYNTTEDYIMSLIIPKITRKKTTYSYISWFNNHICRSDGEYIIANFLVDNDIEYIYEKKYDNSKKRCDFYLVEYDVYVEYMGMNIDQYEDKINFLYDNKIKHISSSDIEYIKEEVIKYVSGENK